MFDLPLHPIMVHFPIVLGALLPVLALVLGWAIRKNHLPGKAWALVTAAALVYCLSAVVAVELGEDDEDKVEKVVSEEVIEEHEEAGEMIPWIAGALAGVSLVGLVRRWGPKARVALVVLSLAAVVPLVNTGHTGGKLVYQYGAAEAHLSAERLAALRSAGPVRGGGETPRPALGDPEDD